MSEQYTSREERKKQQAQKSANNKKPKKKKLNKSAPLWKKILLTLLAIGIVGMVAGGITFAAIVAGAPPLDDKKLKDSFSSKVYDINGEEITEFGQVKRTYTPYEDIPKVLEDAVLATEDARFYEHSGVDFIRLGGALVANLQEGFGAEGGSTITQQVIKNSLLTTDKTITRKVQEVWLAFQLEQKYSKQEILEMYLNKIYFAGNIYGVAQAAESFYGKELGDLELHEAAMIAGMPQSPNNYNPRTSPEKAEKRRNIVLSLMAKHGFITEAEANEAKKVPVQSTVVEPTEKANPYHAFVGEVIEEIKEKTDIDAGSAGLEIYTTLDPEAQDTVENVLNGDEIEFPDEELQAGIALVDTKTGEIRALGGGRNQPVGGYNYATDTKRQPGSVIKPVLDYGPAIEHLKWSTYKQITDAPYSYSDGTPINNWDRSYKGEMSIRNALADSRNIPAVKAIQEVGLEKAQKFAQGLGIPLDEIYESYAIGGFNDGVSPLQMAGAFSAFGNNGIFIEPHTVKKIVLSDGTEISLAPEPEAAMSDYTAFMITDMMKSVVEYGTGKSVNSPPINIAGKTGTTNFTPEDKAKYNVPSGAAKDAWFVGYNPNYTAAVWTGYNISKDSDKVYLDSSDQRLARAIFKEVFTTVAEGDTSDFEQPDSVVKRAVEIGSSEAVLASDYTPSSKIRYEYFVKGEEPKKVSKKYEKPEKPKKPSNLNINYDQVSNTITVNWSHDQDVTFEVSQSTDEGPYNVVANSKNTSYQVGNVIPGAIYTFQVVAVSAENTRSDAAATKIQVPEPEVDVPELPVEEGQGDDVQNGEDQNDDQNENENENENENGNGNGNSNGNGNENNNGGNGNGENQEDTENEGDTEQTPPSTEATTPPQNNAGKEDEEQQNNNDGE
ncbi:transglycosylase domain-containing protein [Metabacillus sediminilitoris]|uniref:PBP1A family penicillin-binding protein n=1 Tax=Metabacillus sediminilitoris TaxID=2567941 RepID=A0A4S4C6B3_9BACI|nr:PBP1A family penicillin-binding protein [Metabacillus sediminilitoris]QGQ46655.1 PBP1A family penicillin-binding protein [Metabacillus sediminilitoris]THF82805.1 PBP1A family penicillin-binding protein [Metabacillus sediminilitoris]